MKKVSFPLILTIFFIFMSCSENNKNYDLIGKRGIIKYPEATANVYYQTETELEWKVKLKNGEGTAGSEKFYYKRISDELHFLNWIEKDGVTISQVINTKTGDVKTFWSFNDKNSVQGSRSAMFLDGKFSFEE